MKRLLAGLERFWFAPTSPTPVCLYRILFALLALGQAWLIFPDLLTWYGHDAVMSIETARQMQDGPRLSLLIWLNPPDEVVVALLVVQVLASLTLLVGYKSRTSTVIVWVIVQAFSLRNPLMNRGVDAFLRVYGFLLIFAPAGARYAIEAPRERRLYAPWAQRLMQIQVSLAYFQSFWGKIQGETWQNGTACYYIFHNPDLSRRAIPHFLDYMWFYHFLTWMSLGFEVALFTLVWVPRWRYPCLIFAVAFHLGMDLLMNLDLSELAIIAAYATFLIPDDLERWTRALPALARSAYNRVSWATTRAAI